MEGKIIDVIERTTPENAKAFKVIIDALFKIAEQRNPRQYDDEHTSPDQSISDQIFVEVVKAVHRKILNYLCPLLQKPKSLRLFNELFEPYKLYYGGHIIGICKSFTRQGHKTKSLGSLLS